MVRCTLLVLAVLVVIAAGCRLPPEREALRPLPENQSFKFADLLRRARAEASTANEAFYVDAWRDLEDAAASLQQTARYLPKSSEIPASVKDKLASEAGSLYDEAVQLADAARARNVDKANSLLQRINLNIRALRPTDVPVDEPPLDRRRPPQISTTTSAPHPVSEGSAERRPNSPPPPVFPKLPGE